MTATHVRPGLGLIVAALLLTACEADIRADLEVHDDGSGELSMMVVYPDELSELSRVTEPDPVADLAAAAADELGSQWEVTKQEVDGRRAVQATTTFDDDTELRERLDALAGDHRRMVEDVTLDAHRFDLTTVAQPVPGEFDDLRADVTFTAPRQIIGHNADRAASETAQWDLTLTQPHRLHAETQGIGPAPGWWPGALLLGIGVVALAVRRMLRARTHALTGGAPR